MAEVADSVRQMGERSRDPAAEAAQALRLAEQARRGGRLLVVLSPMARPLVAWGIAWMVDGIVYRVLPLAPALFVTSAMGVAALVATLLTKDASVRSPWAEAASRSWWVLILATAAVCAVLIPTAIPAATLVLVLGVLWGLGILLYAVAGRQHQVLALGLVLVLTPVPAALLLPGADAVLLYGLVGGGAMVGTGMWNAMRRP